MSHKIKPLYQTLDTEYAELVIDTQAVYSAIAKGYTVCYKREHRSDLPEFRIEGNKLFILLRKPINDKECGFI